MAQPQPAVLDPDHAADYHLGEDLEADHLARVIVDVEAWLASKIGPLTGTWTQTFAGGGYGSLWLRRPIVEVTDITDAGVAVDSALYSLVDGGRRIIGDYGGTYWLGPVVVTGPLADLDAVRAALVKLLRVDLGDTGREAESGEGRSFSRTRPAETQRLDILRDLLPGAGLF
jgi:hypothetical protein